MVRWCGVGRGCLSVVCALSCVFFLFWNNSKWLTAAHEQHALYKAVRLRLHASIVCAVRIPGPVRPHGDGPATRRGHGASAHCAGGRVNSPLSKHAGKMSCVASSYSVINDCRSSEHSCSFSMLSPGAGPW